MKALIRTIWGKGLVGGCALMAVGAVGVVPRMVHGGAAQTDQAAIVQLVHDSQLEEQTACVAPSDVVASGRVQAVGMSAVNSVLAAIPQVEGNYYTGSELTGLTGLLQRNCVAALTHGQSLEIGGGVVPVACSQVTITGDQAHATCQLVKWLRGRLLTASGRVQEVQPSGLTIVNDDFVKTAEGWRITQEEFHPAPGYEP